MTMKRTISFVSAAVLAICLIFACGIVGMSGILAHAESAATTVKADVSALETEGVNRKFMVFFTENTLESEDAEWVTNQVDLLGDKIKVNGYSLKQINEEMGGVYMQVHWARNQDRGKAGLRVDMPVELKLKESNEDHPAALKANQINTLEIEGGITAPSGIVLPKVYVEYKVNSEYVAGVENARVFSTAQFDQTEDKVSVTNISSIATPDAENYAINVYFDGKVANEKVINQGMNLNIAKNIYINDTPIKDIQWSSRAAAIDVHWFVDDAEGNGYLAIYMKKDIAEAYGIKNDGSDTLEIKEGVRTPNNQIVQSSGRMVYNKEGQWTDDAINVVSAKAEKTENNNVYVYLGFDRAAANVSNAEKEIDKVAVLINGKALSEIEGSSAIYRESEGSFVLCIRVPQTSLSSTADTVIVKAGFEVPNSYIVKEDVTLNIDLDGFTPEVSQKEFTMKDDAITDVKVTLETNGKDMISVKYGDTVLTDNEYTLADNELTIKANYIGTLGDGRFTFTVETYGGTTTFDIVVEKAETPPVSYTVTIEHSEDKMSATVIVVTGGTAVDVSSLSAEGYKLVGVYTDAEYTQAYTAEMKITADTTLYAKWESLSTEGTDNETEPEKEGGCGASVAGASAAAGMLAMGAAAVALSKKKRV